jgi:hypothetical protein
MRSMKILFLPVSGPQGIGEYMRSRIMAEAIHAIWPDVAIDFVLNRHAPYFSECPYPAWGCQASPTQSTSEVIGYIERLRPDIAIFDCSGRAAQYRAAKSVGARVVFISQHKKKRDKAFAWNRLPVIDEHWITQLPGVDAEISLWQKLTLAAFNKPPPVVIGPVFTPPDHTLATSLEKPYVFFAAGGGGHAWQGVVPAEVMALAAKAWHEKTGELCHLLLGPNYRGAYPDYPGLRCYPSLGNAQLMGLLSASRLAVLGGGDMLAQAVALNVTTVGVAVAKDQPPRVAALAKQRLISASQLTVAAILKAMATAAAPPAHGIGNGRDWVVQRLGEWFATSQQGRNS